MFAEAIEDIVKDQCTPAVVRAIESGGSPARLWQALEDAGFLELLAPEAQGGAALPLAELFPILSTFGAYALPLPAGQTILARAVLAPHAAPLGMLTMATTFQRTASGAVSCPLTPFGVLADSVLARDGDDVLLLPCANAQRLLTGVPNSQTASLIWPDERSATRFAGRGAQLSVYAATLYAALLSGAMTRVFEMTLQHCNDRVQFGKSLGKFQAVQHQLSVMAEHTAAAAIAAEAAFRAGDSDPSFLAAAMAKSRTSEAAALVAATAHALHGAMGVTADYDLQLLTRRLHEWRIAHGSEAYWNLLIGQQVLASDEPTLVDFVRSF